MSNSERQGGETIDTFSTLESLIKNIPIEGYKISYEVGGEASGLRVIAEGLNKENSIPIAERYYRKLFLFGVDFYHSIEKLRIKGIKPSNVDAQVIERSISYFVDIGIIGVVRPIWSRSNPKKVEDWERLGKVLTTIEKMCKRYAPKQMHRIINSWAIYNRSNAFDLMDTEPKKALSILRKEALNLKVIAEKYNVDELDPKSVAQPADYYNNLGVIYTDIANIYLSDLFSSKRKFKYSRQKFIDNLYKAQDTFKISVGILENSEFREHHNYQIQKGRVLSNLAFTYSLFAHYLLENSLDPYQKVLNNIRKFKNSYSSADGSFVEASQTKDVQEFDAETHRRMADLLILFLYTRTRFDNDVDIEYKKEENEIIDQMLLENERIDFILNPRDLLLNKINEYLINECELVLERGFNMEFDDRTLLKQTISRYFRVFDIDSFNIDSIPAKTFEDLKALLELYEKLKELV